MPDITIEDTRTGMKVSPYIGADPQPAPASAPPPPPEAPNANGTPAPADTGTPAPATTPPVDDKEPSDPVAPPVDDKDPPARNEKGQFIPKQRFDEVNDRRKRAEAELAQLKGQQKAGEQAAENKYDFDKAEKEYADLVLDGKVDDAIAKRREIRAAEQAEFTRVAAEQATQVNSQLTVKEKIDAIAAQYEKDYPVFNPDSEQFSEDVLDDLQSLYSGYARSGRYTDASVAFQAALDKTLKMHGIEKPAAAPAGNASAPATRTAQSRVEAIVNQPPMIGKTGAGSPTNGDGVLRPSEMTEAELMRLPEATRRRLRGDAL